MPRVEADWKNLRPLIKIHADFFVIKGFAFIEMHSKVCSISHISVICLTALPLGQCYFPIFHGWEATKIKKIMTYPKANQ